MTTTAGRIDTTTTVDAAVLVDLWAVEDAALAAHHAAFGGSPALVECADEPDPWPADEVAAWASTAPPGELVEPCFAALAPAALSPAGQVDALVALERLRSWADAQAARVLAAACPVPADAADKGWAKDEVACALRQSPGYVALRLHVAHELTTRLVGTCALLGDGRISGAHADTLAVAVLPLDDAATAEVERRVLPRAPGQTLSQFRAAVRRAVHAADPLGAEERHARARRDRRVVGRAGEDGMGELWASLGLEELAEVMGVLDATARATRRHTDQVGGRAGDGSSSADTRTLDQLRADALVDLVTGRVAVDHPAAAPPEAVESTSAQDQLSARPPVIASRPRHRGVQVVVAASTLLGLDDEPGEIDGYGPIAASVARRLAHDPTSRWRRVLTDPGDGRLLDYGRRAYRPPADLDAFVRARDRRCRFPACNRRATSCEIDHRHAWEHGGTTSSDNCQSLCARHHHLKHEAGWQVTGDADGELLWRSPTGHRYRSRPGCYEQPRAPDHRPAPF